MACKRVKDFSGLVGRTVIKSSRKPHYWDVFLWQDSAALVANTIGMDASVSGCHCSLPVLADPESGDLLPTPKMGEVHFIKGAWDMEVVAHELQHAIIHRMKMLCPSPMSFIMQDCIEQEEEVCYDFGRWFAHIYRWLWSIDPGDKWEKRKQ